MSSRRTNGCLRIIHAPCSKENCLWNCGTHTRYSLRGRGGIASMCDVCIFVCNPTSSRTDHLMSNLICDGTTYGIINYFVWHIRVLSDMCWVLLFELMREQLDGSVVVHRSSAVVGRALAIICRALVVIWCCTLMSCAGVIHWYHASVVVGRALVVCCWSSAIVSYESLVVPRRPLAVVRCPSLVVGCPYSIVRHASLVVRPSSSVGRCWSCVVGRQLWVVVGCHPSSSSVVVGARPSSTWAGWSRGFPSVRPPEKKKSS